MATNGTPHVPPTQATRAAADAAADWREYRECVDALRAYVEYHRANGVENLPLRRASFVDPLAPSAAAATREREAAACAETPPPTASVATTSTAASGAATAGAPESPAAASLDALRTTIGDCRLCKLCSGRTHLVFGVGDPRAELMFVGEGPGRDEDLQGEPFVGRAGQLLTEIITKGMKLRREDVYIANVVKCRPPENRNPEPDEIAACRPFLERQIDLVGPRVIVALGKFAAQTLLASAVPISRLRGQWHDYRGIRLMPTLHPAYLLRNPADKRLVWEDVKLVMRELGMSP